VLAFVCGGFASQCADMVEEVLRCVRCHAVYTPPPYLMAGRKFCCQSCSVGSACEHQGVRRPVTVRRFDSNFDRFRQVAREKTPYETEKEPHIWGGSDHRP
jgi:hypothetical protein